ncbi:hypothetical protein D3C72_2408950 [compost metagenome]
MYEWMHKSIQHSLTLTFVLVILLRCIRFFVECEEEDYEEIASYTNLKTVRAFEDDDLLNGVA